NAYVVGNSSSHVLVTKYDPWGNLIFTTTLSGSGTDNGNAIAVDSSGNIYVTGSTGGTFPVKGGGGFGGATDAIVTKLNATGDATLYSFYLGGSGADVGYGIAVDANGQAIVTGSTASTNFPTVSAFQGTKGGGTDAFVTNVKADGSGYVYSSF